MGRVVTVLALVSIVTASSARSQAQYWVPGPAAQPSAYQPPPGFVLVPAQPQAPAAQPPVYQPPPGFVLVPAAQAPTAQYPQAQYPQAQYPQAQYQVAPTAQPQWQAQWQAQAPSSTASATAPGPGAEPEPVTGSMRVRLTVGSEGGTVGAGNVTLAWDGDGGALPLDSDVDGSVDNTWGGFAQLEVPLHTFFVVGAQAHVMSASLGGFNRPVLDTNLVAKARYPLGHGRTELFFEVPFGLTWTFASGAEERSLEARDMWACTTTSVGWNVSALVGVRFMFGRVVGLELAAGWGHHEAGYNVRLQPQNRDFTGHLRQSWNDVTSRLGLVIAF